ncbi:Mini zinc finger protein 3 [Glycine soja]
MSNINTNQPLPTNEVVTYRECLHNHATTLGQVSYDGCLEFLIGEDTLLCACCGCHRSYHRKHIIFNAIPQTQA